LTTRECVHIVTCGHFQSRDIDGGHIIRSTIAETTCCTQTSWLFVFQNRSYCRSKFYIAGIGILDHFAPVTLTLT